jgi:hypothetical protein
MFAMLPQVIRTLSTGKLYYCGVFHPDDDKQNVLMGGCADKKIYQFDLNTGDVVQVRGWNWGLKPWGEAHKVKESQEAETLHARL